MLSSTRDRKGTGFGLGVLALNPEPIESALEGSFLETRPFLQALSRSVLPFEAFGGRARTADDINPALHLLRNMPEFHSFGGP